MRALLLCVLACILHSLPAQASDTAAQPAQFPHRVPVGADGREVFAVKGQREITCSNGTRLHIPVVEPDLPVFVEVAKEDCTAPNSYSATFQLPGIGGSQWSSGSLYFTASRIVKTADSQADIADFLYSQIQKFGFSVELNGGTGTLIQSGCSHGFCQFRLFWKDEAKGWFYSLSMSRHEVEVLKEIASSMPIEPVSSRLAANVLLPAPMAARLPCRLICRAIAGK